MADEKPENTGSRQEMHSYPPQYFNVRKKKSNWWIPLLIIGLLVVVVAVFGLVMFSMAGARIFASKKIDVKENSVLVINFDNYQEYTKSSLISIISGEQRKASFLDILTGIRRAKDDPKIKGIYLKPGLKGPGQVKSDEIREALLDFKKSGKFIYAFIESGNEMTYNNCLAADSIFMPAESMLEFNGFGASALFFKGFFDKIGVNFRVIGFEDFKSAGEMYSRTGFSDSARKQLEVMIDQRQAEFVRSVAAARRIEEKSVLGALQRGVYTTDTLKALGLIDGCMIESDMDDFLLGKVYPNLHDQKKSGKRRQEAKLNKININSYVCTAQGDDDTYDSNVQIAIINGVGAISSGLAPKNPFDEDISIRSGDFVKNLRKAREDKKVKAIIIRIDSPGGAVTGSDEIWQEIIKTKKVKPVYASMSDVAASGGYYMAMACDTIVAHPATITGSIGVILAIPNFSGLMGKLGLSADTVSASPAAQFLNGMYPYSEKDITQLYGMTKNMYFRFLGKVAASRHMSVEEVRTMAKGRVWLGTDAKRLGLVDTLGGIQTAINLAKRRLGVPEWKKVIIRSFPRVADEFESFMKYFTSDEDEDTEAEMAKTLGIERSTLIAGWTLLPEELRRQVIYFANIARISSREKAVAALPFYFDPR